MMRTEFWIVTATNDQDDLLFFYTMCLPGLTTEQAMTKALALLREQPDMPVNTPLNIEVTGPCLMLSPGVD